MTSPSSSHKISAGKIAGFLSSVAVALAPLLLHAADPAKEWIGANNAPALNQQVANEEMRIAYVAGSQKRHTCIYSATLAGRHYDQFTARSQIYEQIGPVSGRTRRGDPFRIDYTLSGCSCVKEVGNVNLEWIGRVKITERT